MPQIRFAWHVWPGRLWPASAAQEEAFVADLERHGTADGHFGRGDITAVLNALRCGLDVDALLDCAPGVNCSRLLGAYRHLAERLAAATSAWSEIVADPTLATITHHGPSAIAVLPGIEGRLFQVRVVLGADHLPHAVAELSSEVSARVLVAARTEERLEDHVRDGDVDGAVEVGRALYHPFKASRWSDPLHLPSRVTQLTPPRVEELLGDRRG